MEKLRNLQSRDLALEVDRDRDQLIQQTMRQLNAHFGRRCTTTPMAVHRVKVTFKDEPGEGSGVARSFYTAIALALLSNDKLPNLDCVQSVSKGMQASSTCHHDYNSSMTIHRNRISLMYFIVTSVVLLLCLKLLSSWEIFVHKRFTLKSDFFFLQSFCVFVCRSNAALKKQRSGKREEKRWASSRISERPRQVDSSLIHGYALSL